MCENSRFREVAKVADRLVRAVNLETQVSHCPYDVNTPEDHLYHREHKVQAVQQQEHTSDQDQLAALTLFGDLQMDLRAVYRA